MKSLETELHEKEKIIRELTEALGRRSKGSHQESKTVSEVVESYKRLGLTTKEARIAAGVESAVTEVSEAQRKLRDVAKAVGMSDAEAEAFATPRRRVITGFNS